MAICCENFLYGNDFDAVLVISSSYRFNANAFKPVEKIATGMKKIVTNVHNHSIAIKQTKQRFFTKNTSLVAKRKLKGV